MNWKPGESIAIVIDDKTAEERRISDIDIMVEELRPILNKFNFDISMYGSENGVFKKVHNSKVISAVKDELIESYGGMSKNKEGEETNLPYIVMGIVSSAVERLQITPYQ